MTLPLFPVTVVGSWPRSDELLKALSRRRRGALASAEFERIAEAGVLEALRVQEQAGVDIVTDGEQHRDNFYSFVADCLEGVRLMTLAELLDVIEDRAAFEKTLEQLDVPAFSLSTPACIGKIARRRPLAVEQFRFLSEHTSRPVKVTLPGPYILTRAMWVKGLSSGAYATKEELAADVVEILRAEIRELVEAGAQLIQLDEPVLTELVFTQGKPYTFMCAALAARSDPAEELEWAVSLINSMRSAARGARLALHVCRGNWSTDESVLLAGSYAPLMPYFRHLDVDQLVLEFATVRAGSIDALLSGGEAFTKELGIGVVNPRTTEIESVTQIVAKVEEALRFLPPERISLNPDCGFGTFASRPMNTPENCRGKLEAMSAAAVILRERYKT